MKTNELRVFVAGATGTIGQPVVRSLVAAGHHVIGLTRTEDGGRRLAQQGVEPVIGDALDADLMDRLLRAARPTHVLHLLTALPKGGPTHPRDVAATNELRTRGTANLLRAAIGAGARRIVAESFTIAYGVGDLGAEPLAEDKVGKGRHPNEEVQAIVDAARSLEEQMAAAAATGAIDAIVLRFGYVYGPGVPSTEGMIDALRRRKVPLIRGAHGLASFVHVEDAAAATVAALETGRSGAVYNISDDHPVGLMDYVRATAEAAGAPRPWSVPRWLARVVAPFGTELAIARVPMSNARARRELSWSPVYRTLEAGLVTLTRVH